jgi:hypothetical protein
MRQTTEWVLANNRFETFRSSLPSLIDEDCVSEYHAIIDSLEQAGESDLNDFRIDANKLAFRIMQACTAEHINPRVRVQYSNKRYCDWEYFCCKLDKLQDFLNRPDKITT